MSNNEVELVTSKKSIRAAVVGVGHLGREHARILSKLSDVELVAVVDVDRIRAEEVANATGSCPLGDFSDLSSDIDAVSVVVPTALHEKVSVPLLERGIGVLVEKPLARSVAETERILAAARCSGATLAVGHTERYNPAVEAVRSLVLNPRFIEGHRLGTFTDRSLDIDVVLDLMIHDLDLVLSFVQEEVTAIEAVGVPVLTDHIDIANARLRFSSGCIANLTASRISRERVRKVRFFQENSYVSVDFSEQGAESWKLVGTKGQEPSIQGGKLPVVRAEPLERELVDFVNAVRERRCPMVSGEDGVRAVALAHRVVGAMQVGP